MDWNKCQNCEFLVEVTANYSHEGGVQFLCRVTGETYRLTQCKHDIKLRE